MSDAATTGVVRSFDEGRGIGTIDAAGEMYAFHCTQIADATRTVRVGATVQFRIVPGRRGDWEAAEVLKVDE